MEIAVIGLNDEVEKFKTEGNQKVKQTIQELGEERINPLLDEMLN